MALACTTRCLNIWDIESVKTEKFKFELYKFIEIIPDEPKMTNYVKAAISNIILDQLSHRRAQGINPYLHNPPTQGMNRAQGSG